MQHLRKTREVARVRSSWRLEPLNAAPRVAQYCPATLGGFAGDKSTSQVTIAPSPNWECPRDDPVQVPAKRQRQGQFDVRPCKPAVSLSPSSRGLSFFRVPTTGTPNQRNRVLFLSSRHRYS